MTGGLDESQVDARVRAGVLDFAETGDTSNVPAANKLPDATSGDKGAVRAVTDALVDTEAGHVRTGLEHQSRQAVGVPHHSVMGTRWQHRHDTGQQAAP